MSAGKGDSPRPVDGEKYRKNWVAIFIGDNWKNEKSGKAIKSGKNGKPGKNGGRK